MEKNKTILVVDDSDINLKVIKRYLIKEGYEVLLCNKSRESLEILNNNEVDLVLLDWMMPEMSGIEVCKLIKQDEKLKFIPVIMVTARAESKDLYESLSAGADDYIRKPINKMEMIARVKAGLRTGALQKHLNHANIKLKDLDKTKDEFLSIVSHDLRSPISSIVTISNLLLRQPDEDIAPKHKEFIEGINKTGRNLIHLIEDLLDLSKIEDGGMKLKLEKVNLNEFLKSSVWNFETIAADKNIALTYQAASSSSLIELDASKMTQVINNLLSNAVKFTEKGGSVTMRSTTVNNGFAEVQVEDTGIGIKEKDIPHIFEKFSRLSRPGTNAEKGAGLGMVITKKIIELHGGKIWVKSKPGSGTTFNFTIPLK